MLPGDETLPLTTNIMITEEGKEATPERICNYRKPKGNRENIQDILLCIALHNFHHQRANVFLDNDNGPGSWSKLRHDGLETRWQKTMTLMVSEMVITVSQGYCDRDFFKQKTKYTCILDICIEMRNPFQTTEIKSVCGQCICFTCSTLKLMGKYDWHYIMIVSSVLTFSGNSFRISSNNVTYKNMYLSVRKCLQTWQILNLQPVFTLPNNITSTQFRLPHLPVNMTARQ